MKHEFSHGPASYQTLCSALFHQSSSHSTGRRRPRRLITGSRSSISIGSVTTRFMQPLYAQNRSTAPRQTYACLHRQTPLMSSRSSTLFLAFSDLQIVQIIMIPSPTASTDHPKPIRHLAISQEAKHSNLITVSSHSHRTRAIAGSPLTSTHNCPSH